jgi:hypothetical protein
LALIFPESKESVNDETSSLLKISSSFTLLKSVLIPVPVLVFYWFYNFSSSMFLQIFPVTLVSIGRGKLVEET